MRQRNDHGSDRQKEDQDQERCCTRMTELGMWCLSSAYQGTVLWAKCLHLRIPLMTILLAHRSVIQSTKDQLKSHKANTTGKRVRVSNQGTAQVDKQKGRQKG